MAVQDIETLRAEYRERYLCRTAECRAGLRLAITARATVPVATSHGVHFVHGQRVGAQVV